MNRIVQLLTLFAACAPASAYEFRARFVERVGNADTVIDGDSLDNTSRARRRIRLQLGVFDDPVSAAPFGGLIGWNLGSIVVGGNASNSDETRTPGRLAPFTAATGPLANGNPPLPDGDPFQTLTDIDATRGLQTLPWGCDAQGLPLPQPAPLVLGRNTFVSVFEITIDPADDARQDYEVTFTGNLLAAAEWRTFGEALPPDCGDPNNPNDDVPGAVAYFPVPTDPAEFTRSLFIRTGVPTPGGAAAVVLGLLMGCRRQRPACRER